MAEAISVTRTVSGTTDKTLTFEAGKLAGQADGAVTVRQGDTVVLTTATAAKSVREGIDFFPLTVDVEERMYAAGRIPGSFFRREGRPSTDAILTCRLIDRPLRPSFVDGLRNEIQVVVTVLSLNPQDLYDGHPWTFWQYTSTGLVPGVRGKVDVNVFAGSAEGWAGWLAARAP